MQIENIIEEKKLKVTSARKELLEILITQNRPISYEDIKDKITMDKATFYRNISKFEDESIVSSFESNGKKRYYEMQKIPHAHFICNSCNSIECLKGIFDVHIENYIIEDMVIKGICSKCNTSKI